MCSTNTARMWAGATFCFWHERSEMLSLALVQWFAHFGTRGLYCICTSLALLGTSEETYWLRHWRSDTAPDGVNALPCASERISVLCTIGRSNDDAGVHYIQYYITEPAARVFTGTWQRRSYQTSMAFWEKRHNVNVLTVYFETPATKLFPKTLFFLLLVLYKRIYYCTKVLV